MDLWRVSNHITLNGEGSRRTPARWHSGGERIVYLASATGNALLEVLAHLQVYEDEVPQTFTLLHVITPDNLNVPLLFAPKDDAWKLDEAFTRKLGDGWLKSKRSALARVPSALLPFTFNYLLNPSHPDAGQIKIAASHQAPFDSRLLHQVR